MRIDEDNDFLCLIHHGLEPFDVVNPLEHQVNGVSCTRAPKYFWPLLKQLAAAPSSSKPGSKPGIQSEQQHPLPTATSQKSNLHPLPTATSQAVCVCGLGRNQAKQ
jgi:hypothetical protein